MKRAKILLILFALLLVFSANAYAANELWINGCPPNADPGATVQFPVYGEWDFDGEPDTLTGLQLGLNFNQAVLDCTAATRGGLFTGFGISTSDLAGDFRILLNDGTGVGIAPGSGLIATFTCTVMGTAGSSTPVGMAGGYPEGFVFLVDPDGTPDTGDEYIDEAIPAITGGCTFTVNGSACTDADNDTYAIEGGACGEVDCNDNNNAVYPGATEICNNIDDDCDGTVDDGIAAVPTNCGQGACAATGESTCQGGVMVDNCTPGTPSTETCNNIDDDCDGTADDGIAPVPTTCGAGVCARTGQSTCQGGVMVDNCTPGATTGTDNDCDDVDENCNGTSDENYVPTPTTCGVGACASTGEMACVLPNHALADTCRPNLPQTEGPFGDATCGDSTDNDCDGAADGADVNCVQPRAVDIPEISADRGAAVNIPITVDDATGIAAFQFTVTYDPAVLNCTAAGTGALTAGWTFDDNPIAGQIAVLGSDPSNNGIASGSGSLVVLVCSAIGTYGSSTPMNITFSELVDVNAQVIPGAATAGSVTINSCTPTGVEVCDGIDNNCNGTVDDGIATVPTNCGVGVCARTGQSTCQNGVMVDNCTPGATTGTDNDCDDVDENCNGTSDENYVPTPTTCGVGACASTGEMVCVLPNHALASTCVPNAPQTEGPFGNATCSDSIDNDCDGAADGSDIDCVEPRLISTPTVSYVPGIPVEIPISISDAAGVAAFQFTVSYNPAMLNCTASAAGSLNAGWSFDDNPSAGQISVIGYDPANSGLGAGSGSIVKLVCTTGTNLGSTLLDITFSELVDVNANEIPGTSVDGSLTIVSCIPTGEEVCDGADNDCDGQTDEGIAPVMLRTTCGEGACKRAAYNECIGGAMAQTCTPGASAAETCNNIDDDCDGQVDDGVTRQTSCGIGGCARTGTETCTAGLWGGNTCTPASPSAEVCDGQDNDCDGSTDESIAAVRTTCGLGACVARGTATCAGGQMVDSCTPKPAGTETCNRIDDDCDGTVDDGLTTATTCGVGACVRSGQSTCTNGQMVNSCTPGTPSAEVCDSQDNDCDGSTDESIAAVRTTCGVGVCKRAGLITCSNGAPSNNCVAGTPGVEGPVGNATCADTLDNDCDGAADAGDANCQ